MPQTWFIANLWQYKQKNNNKHYFMDNISGFGSFLLRARNISK